MKSLGATSPCPVQIVEGHLAVPDAARLLALSYRHLRRLLARVRQDGPAIKLSLRGMALPQLLTGGCTEVVLVHFGQLSHVKPI